MLVASGTIDIATALHKFLPKTARMPNGDLITIDWYDGEPTQQDKVRPYPYGVFTRVSHTRLGPTRYSDVQVISLPATPEVYTYDPALPLYPVVQRDIVPASMVVTGISGASPRTFVQGTDYRIAALAGYSTMGAIEWLPGGTLPTPGSLFTIAYNHRMVDFLLISRSILTYRLTLHVSGLEPGQRGASIAYDRGILGDFVLDSVEEYLAMRRGQKLAGEQAEVIVGDIAVSGRLPIDEGETVQRSILDLRLPRFINGLALRVPLIGSTEHSIQVALA